MTGRCPYCGAEVELVVVACYGDTLPCGPGRVYSEHDRDGRRCFGNERVLADLETIR